VAQPDAGAPAEQAADEPGGEAERESAAPDKEPAAEKPGTEIKVGQSQFGEILFDGDDQAIYLFDKEASAKSECYGACAEAWPPVLTKGEPVGAGGAKQSLLGTTKRDDGSVQVTYDGQPLYYYAHEGPGEVLCHGVNEFGGLWLVLGADGQAL
jgi:predicted lipoprotein with Yx(FWY)xxD motif